MKLEGLEKARRRLEHAGAHLRKLRQIDAFDLLEYQDTWFNFLVHLQSVPEILKAAALHNPRDRQWFGGRNKKLFDDPLLRYVREARSTDFHGLDIAPTIETSPNRFAGMVRPAIEITLYAEDGTEEKVTNPLCLAFEGELQDGLSAKPVLQTIRNEKHNNVFPPPTEHLGKPIDDPSPLRVAELAFEFYSSLFEEALKRTD